MKHQCSNAQAQVYPYIDGEMAWYRRTRIWWHLRRCPPCADGFSFEEHLKHRIHEGCMEQVPEELVERLRAFLREQGPTPGPPAKGA